MLGRTHDRISNVHSSCEDRRHPKIYHKSYLVLAKLSKYVRECVARWRLTGSSLRILDIGCGTKPYYPFFGEGAHNMYIGIDAMLDSEADILCVSEALPLADESFDVVLCTQVLEHVDSPRDTVREAYRVLKENGLLILSTHGLWYKHGQDYWRWTDLGLRKMLSPFFREIEIKSCGGSWLALFQILNLYVTRLPFGRSPLYFINNVLGQSLDRVFWDERLVINYFVVARK